MKTLNAHAKEDSIEIMFQNQQDYEQIIKKGAEELNSFRLFFHDDDTRTIMLQNMGLTAAMEQGPEEPAQNQLDI